MRVFVGIAVARPVLCTRRDAFGLTPSDERTGDLTGTVTGDLTLLGVTNPVTLDVTYNGVANPPWYGGRDVIGFDASTTLNRSDVGMGAYIPNIGDAVKVDFSGEFLQDE